MARTYLGLLDVPFKVIRMLILAPTLIYSKIMYHGRPSPSVLVPGSRSSDNPTLLLVGSKFSIRISYCDLCTLFLSSQTTSSSMAQYLSASALGALPPCNSNLATKEVEDLHARVPARSDACLGRHADLRVDIQHRPRATCRPDPACITNPAVVSEVDAVVGAVEVVLFGYLYRWVSTWLAWFWGAARMRERK